MWNLNLENISDGNCYDSMIYLIIHGISEYPDLMYLVTYSLLCVREYDVEGVVVGINISTLGAVEELFGLTIEETPSDNDLHNIISSKIEEFPVGFTTDPYYCKWSPFYEKTHYYHLVLITGIDKKERKYICADIYYPTAGIIYLSYDELQKICQKLVLFCYKKKELIDKWHILKLLKQYLPIGYNLVEEKNRAIDFFTNKIKPGDVVAPNQMDSSIMLIHISFLVDAKKLFTKSLLTFDKLANHPVFASIYPLLERSAEKYTLLKGMLIKYALTGRMKAKVVEEMINEIFETDKNTLDALLNVIEERMKHYESNEI